MRAVPCTADLLMLGVLVHNFTNIIIHHYFTFHFRLKTCLFYIKILLWISMTA